MAQRTVCLCDGKYIGIELIYTVFDGRQINIPEKLKEIRAKSQNNELFCPCGCGSNLILVAGDKNLREQHFRLKDGSFNEKCHVVTEGKISIDSKIVLKCWLDDKLKAADIETRVPIQAVDDINRKYEFSFLSREKKVALSYCHERVNLSDKKMDLLKSNSQGIHIIYVVDLENGGSDGQYPEGLMKVQNRQGYCLLLEVNNADYSEALMTAVFYAQDIIGLWQQVEIVDGHLSDFLIDDRGRVVFDNEPLDSLQKKASVEYANLLQVEKTRRVEEEKRRSENSKKIFEEDERKRQKRQRLQEEEEIERQHQREEVEKRRSELEVRRRIQEEQQLAEISKREDDLRRNMESNFSQQETQVRDAEGNRWIKCDFCGKIAMDDAFNSYGGIGHINLGTCKECSNNNPAVKQRIEVEAVKDRVKYNPNICPECGAVLKEKSGQFGKFVGCSNFPTCRYAKKIRL